MVRRSALVLVAFSLVVLGHAPAHAVGHIGGHLAGACDLTLAQFPGANATVCTGRATGTGWVNWWNGVYTWSATGADLTMDVWYDYDYCEEGYAYGRITVHPLRVEAPDGRIDENATLYTYFEWNRFLGYVRLVHDYFVIGSSDGSYAYDTGLEGAMLWEPRNASYLDTVATCAGGQIAPLDVRLNGGEPGYDLF